MTKYYNITADRIVIRPLAFLVPIAWALMALLLLLPVAMLLILSNGRLEEIQPRSLASFILLVPLLLACIPLFTYSRRQLIFDRNDHMIYRRTIFATRPLINFNQVADFIWKPGVGIACFIKSKDDRFGKGYRISPSFSGNNDKAKLEYEQAILPAIQLMLAEQPVVTAADLQMPAPGKLVFFAPLSVGHQLKPRGFFPYLLIIVFFGVAAWSVRNNQFGWLAFIPVLIAIAMLSKRIVFNVLQQQVRLFIFGIPFASYPFADAAGFSIVRKTLNGMYNGTDVRMKFLKPGSKRTRELLLADFRKTSPIEPLIREVEYILKSPSHN